MGRIVRAGAGFALAVALAIGGGGCVHPDWRTFGPFGYPVYVQAPPAASAGQPPPVTVQAPPVKSQSLSPDNRGTALAQPAGGDVTPVDNRQTAQPPGVPAVMPTQTGQGGGAPPAPGSSPLPLPQLPPANTNPHVRDSATARGGRLDLGPNDYPIDRVLDITKRLEECAAVNQLLLSKMAALEKEGRDRESAMSETLREVDTAAAEVIRARADLAVVKRELDALKERMKRMEKEEVETLKMVIAAVEKILKERDDQ
jgi:hypothetical protein